MTNIKKLKDKKKTRDIKETVIDKKRVKCVERLAISRLMETTNKLSVSIIIYYNY